jgi:hypothetical protein
MSSIHLYIHSQPSCPMHDHAHKPSNAGKDLHQGLAAMIVLAVLERLLQAAGRDGDKQGHTPGTDAGQVRQATPAQPGANADEGAMGVLKPFLELLLLLALLCKHGNKHHGGANPVADKVADQLTDKLDGPEQDLSSPPADDKAPADTESPEYDAVAMMVSGLREGHAKSLLAGVDEEGFEREVQRMASELREELGARGNTGSPNTPD